MRASVKLKKLLSENTAPAAPALAWSEADGAVRCLACGHRCLVQDGRAGVCRVRFNAGGTLRVPWGYAAGVQVDPIEKKPFFHAYPGRDALSFGMLGCDYHCGYCQNWVTSQALRDDQAIARPSFTGPEKLVTLAKRSGAPVAVSTYNEPLITSDWAVEIFKAMRERGIVCGFVSNGNGTPEVLEFIRPFVDLYKVDLKGFNDREYRKLGGVLENVPVAIRPLKTMDFWVEIVTLRVPTPNASDEARTRIAAVRCSGSARIPWHVTAFHPDYRMIDPPRTSVDTLLRAADIGRQAGLRFVYPGNLPGAVGDGENTNCPRCGALCIHRVGFYVEENRMTNGQCPDCGLRLPGVWENTPPKQSTGTGIPLPIRL